MRQPLLIMKMRGEREVVINIEDHSGSFGGHTDAMKRKREMVIFEILRMRLLLRIRQDDSVVGDAVIEWETGATSHTSMTTEYSRVMEDYLNLVEDVDKGTEVEEMSIAINDKKVDSGGPEVSSDTRGGHVELSKEEECISEELSMGFLYP